ncbi:trichohyalin [Drosophila innubila]|uniref:trichohyalin n=1 Tax=Drosophila innubila TaxID=198719 RepID=UPI00148DEF09|nr:trichohyalin [Drosophila innubila]
MNTPGVSLFQGAETMKVNSTLERQEEEEALQDQKRREAELGNLLENAFDDLEDDEDESTVDSTTNFPSNILPPPLPLLPALSEQQQLQQQPQQQLDYVNASDMHKLKMLLESKTHELNNINKLASDARTKAHELQKRLSMAEAELERARLEKQHTHELLVESKEKCSNLDNNIEKLRGEKKALETENTQLVGKLETVQTVLDDVQRKYDMVERDKHRRDDRNVELRVKQLEDHHSAQTELSQRQLSQISDQLDKKQQELDQMHMRYNALHKSHENMLLEKAQKINELNEALDVAQRRSNQLAVKQNYETECTRQKQCIVDLHGQIAQMEQTIAELTDRLNGTTAEMDLMDTLIQQHQSESETPNRLPSHLSGSTPLNPAERMSKFKQDFYRTFAMMKSKREEVRKLEKQLEDRTNELRKLREAENKMLVQLETLRDEKMRLENRFKVLQEQLEERQHNSSLSTSKLQSELDTVIAERDALRQKTQDQAVEHQKLDKHLKQVQLDLDELQQEHENLKRKHNQLIDDNRELRVRSTADTLRLELERHKILLKDAQGEVDRLKKLYSDISNDKESLNYQLRKLSETDTIKELQEQRQHLSQLQRNLQLAELKSQELAKILATEKLQHERELETAREKWERQKNEEELAKTKAKEGSNNCSKCGDQLAEITKMEIQVLKLQNLNSMQSKKLDELTSELEQSKTLKLELEVKMKEVQEQAELQEHFSPIKQSACTSDGAGDGAHVGASPASPEISQARIKQIEQRVRDEMAKLFAAELKRYTTRMQQSEERSLCLHREYQLVCRDLQQRQTEVELLKQTILAEREQMQELLGEKDEKHKQMLQKCRNELQAKSQRINDLIREMDEQHASIESERRSMKTVMAEWDKQKQSIEEVEEHWRNQVQTLREAHEEALQAVQQRYQSAKRTAQNYKIYAEDKDAHMKREYDRIKQEYHNSLTKIEATMQKHFQRKSRELENQEKRKDNDKENEPCNR